MSDKTTERKAVFTRRQILKSVPLGIAAAAVGAVSGRALAGFVRRKRTTPDLPEDSIFAPDKSRYPRA